MQSTTALPLGDRIANALIAYATYLGKLFVPIDMALPYPLVRVSVGAAILPLLVVAAITIAVYAARRAAPYLPVGWLWFLGTLVPVIGIVAIGTQSMADRYTYFSYIGLFIALTFGALDLARRFRIPSTALAAIAVIAVAGYCERGRAPTPLLEGFRRRSSRTRSTSPATIPPPNTFSDRRCRPRSPMRRWPICSAPST